MTFARWRYPKVRSSTVSPPIYTSLSVTAKFIQSYSAECPRVEDNPLSSATVDIRREKIPIDDVVDDVRSWATSALHTTQQESVFDE